METISDIAALETLLDDGAHLLLRGRQGNLGVLLRGQGKKYPSSEELARLRYGYELSRSLDFPGIVKVLDLVKQGNGLVLVMEDFGACLLRNLVDQKRLTLLDSLEIAIQLAGALGELHRRQVIHRDVNPSNVLVNLQAREVKLANFDLASRLASGGSGFADRERLDGTLAYISPEQTGRMNRAVDHRTDIYSLGVTLYEMVTGRLPFQGSDPMALVHGHLAVEPPPPHQLRPEIPRPLSAVVLKLLAKDPEERYQSAYGLQVDLRQCQDLLRTTGTIAELVPGQRDVSATFRVSQKLYGREHERAQLTAAFERLGSGGRTELFLVAGHSGVGKSSLVNEILRPLARRCGYLGAGKFDQLQNVPYQAWIQAFGGLIRQILSEPEDQVAAWRSRIAEALAANGRVVTEVVPQLELIVGPQPPVPALGPTESQNRFNLLFQRLVSTFAREEHPLVLLLDDLQWADSASLGLLQVLLSNPLGRHLLVVGAHRDDEASAHGALDSTVAELKKASVPISRVELARLGLDDVRHLLADTLGRPGGSDLEELAALVFQRTEGNPFFVNQFVTSLHTRQLLTFEPVEGRWRWSLERIQRENITDNVVSLMTDRMGRLSAQARAALQRAACTGNTFSLETIAVIGEQSVPETGAALWEAVQEGLLVPLDDTNKYVRAGGPGVSAVPGDVQYKFLHDRVQEAAYRAIPEGSRRELHLKIGRLLLRSTAENEREELVFTIVNQLNRAAVLILQPEERDELAGLNLLASRRAKLSSAYDAALQYAQAGVALLGEDAWETRHALALDLHRQLAECQFLVGQFDVAERGFELALSRASTPDAKQEIYMLELELYLSRGQFMEAIRLARAGLATVGVELPEGEAVAPATSREAARLQTLLAGRAPGDLIDLPLAQDPMERTRVLFFAQAIIYAAYVYPDLFALMALMAVNRALEHGHAPGSATCYVEYAMIVGPTTGDHATAHGFGRLALALSERLEPLASRCLVRFMFASFVNPWREPVRTSRPMLEKAYRESLESGTFFWAGLCAMQDVLLGHLTGENLDTQMERSSRYLSFFRAGGDQHLQAIYPLGAIEHSMLLLTLGSVPADSAPWHQDAVLQEKLVNPGVLVSYEIFRLRHRVLMEDFAGAQELARLIEARLVQIFGHVLLIEFVFYQGLLLAALHPTAADRESVEKTLDESLGKLRHWSASCPESFFHKERLLAAERARIAGQETEAMALYDQAIEAAAAGEHTHEEALASELAARVHLSAGRKRVARAYLEEARHLYARWGARAKVAQMERRYPELLRPASALAAGAPQASIASLDLTTVLKASQAISGEIVLDELLRKLMSTMVENAGAQRGMLLLSGDNPLSVEARQHEGARIDVAVHQGPASERTDLSMAIVRYVERTRERVVLADAVVEGPFRADEHVQRRHPRSVLCMPVVKQQKLLGILYLENGLVAGAFTPARCQVLDLLSAQAAISLENARLYDTLEQRVRQRTRQLTESNEELSLALQRLKDAQGQLVMQEKLASLGTLTAGIAHEIKNPLNFVNNFALLSVDLAVELHGQVEAQRDRLEARSVREIEELSSDLRENAKKIAEHGRRADGIVKSMLELSRQGGGEKRPVDLNALVDQYSALAYQGLRSQNPSLQVTIETNLDPSLKPVEAISQELGRVILNLVSNACHAVETRRRGTGAGFEPRVKITTREVVGNMVEIRIRDNGTGIPAAIRDKIFNPFFTTKPPGQGTGLGLSISHEIVKNGHGGTIAVESEEGQYAELIVTLPRRTHREATP